jgi:hypothetical protein
LKRRTNRSRFESLEQRRLLSIEPSGYFAPADPSGKQHSVASIGPFLSAGDRFEPNDARDLAANLGVLGDRTELDLTIHANDNDDWYRFDAAASGTATVDLSFVLAQGDVDVRIYDSTDELLDSSETNGSFEHTSFEVTAGDTYYIYVLGHDSATNPDYDLVIDAPGTAVGFSLDALEPNNSFSSPKDLGTLGYRAELDLSIHQASNDDYYRFTAAASGTATVDVAFQHSQGDIDLSVFSSSGTELDLSESIENSEQVSFDVTAGQTYIVRVYGFDGEINPNYDLYITAPGPAGQISGHKWNDLDGNRTWDAGEPGLAGWTIYVDQDANGQFDSGEPSAVTLANDPLTPVDETGSYLISGVAPGNHIVAEVPKPGWVQTFPHDLPDLLATAFDVDLTTLDASDAASIDFTVLNQGTATAQNFDLGFYLSKDPIITTADRSVGFLENPVVLGAGQNYSDTVAIQLPPPGDAFWTGEGTYYLGIISDDLLELPESSETNNANRGELLDREIVTIRNVNANDLPDLAGTAFNAVATTSTAGTTASLTYTIGNLGTNPAEGFDLGFYLSRDATIDPANDRLLHYIIDPASLAPGANSSATVNVTLPGPGDTIYSGDGVYFIGQYVDDAFEVPESNETNNANRGVGLDRDSLTITGTAGVASQFQIVVNFPDATLTASQKAIFTIAAQRWSQVITGDLPDVNVAGHGLVDDLVIDATAPAIDGVGQILGQAGPSSLRSGSLLPAAGSMEFDSADVASLEAAGQLDEVILHEMGHVLGIGSIWTAKGLLTGTGGADPRYTGAQATAAYQSVFNTAITSIPVENTGAAGTRDSHWRETVFNNEIMTGFLNGPASPLSRVTAASLADLGYVVNIDGAEIYTPLFPAGLTGSEASQSPVTGRILAIGDAFTILDPEATVGVGAAGHLQAQSILEPLPRTVLTPLSTMGRVRDNLASLVFSPLPGTHLVTVLSGATTPNIDFGNRAAVSVAGRHVFYNQSKFDGNDVTANASDDAAIATDKSALLPGGTASFANYTSFGRGLNGIMVDINGLPATTLSASDFEFKVGNSDTPSAWTPLAASPTVTVRPNGGNDNSSRVTLIWPTGAAIKQWLQVTLKANDNTGLTTPDVFYFGNAVGESGNVTGDYSVSITDEIIARNNPVSINPGTTVINRFDYNRDGTVSVVDQILARNNITTGATKLKQITVPAALQGRGLSAQGLTAAAMPTLDQARLSSSSDGPTSTSSVSSNSLAHLSTARGRQGFDQQTLTSILDESIISLSSNRARLRGPSLHAEVDDGLLALISKR